MLKENAEAAIESCQSEVKEINPLAKVVKTEYSNISIDFFLEEFENFNKSEQFTNFNNDLFNGKENLNSCNTCNDKEHSHNHSCANKNQIENIMVKTNVKNMESLDTCIGRILWDLSEDHEFSIIRLKGIVKIKSEKPNEESLDKIYSLQGLYDIYEFCEVKVNNDNNLKIQLNEGTFVSKILFIGKNVRKNKSFIEAALNE